MSAIAALSRSPAWPFSLLALCLGGWPLTGFGLSAAHECSYCHDVHSAVGIPILAEQEVEVLCLTCHIAGALEAAPDADVHTNRDVSQYADFRATCLDCHNPHDNVENWIGDHEHIVNDPTDWGINIKLVGSAGSDGFAVIQSLEWDATMGEYLDGIRYVVFEQLGDDTDPALQIHSFSDENMDGLQAPDGEAKDGPCEVCHNQTKYHCNGDGSNIGACGTEHNTGRECTQCHHHDANFLPQSGGGRP
jgi:predicted CXXCH cytochrome family protein